MNVDVNGKKCLKLLKQIDPKLFLKNLYGEEKVNELQNSDVTL
jgi:hypothetical protein